MNDKMCKDHPFYSMKTKSSTGGLIAAVLTAMNNNVPAESVKQEVNSGEFGYCLDAPEMIPCGYSYGLRDGRPSQKYVHRPE